MVGFSDGFQVRKERDCVIGRGFDFTMDSTGSPHVPDEVFGFVIGFDLSVIDDDYAVGDHLYLAEDVGGDEDGMILREFFD